MKSNALYARFSSHAQDDGYSIEAQIEACEKAAGGPLTHYIDRAKTGRSISGRDQLLLLIADAEAGKIGKLYLYKFDRIGRSAETHAVVASLEDAEVEVISVTEGREALTRGIQLVIGEHYSKVLAERTRDGLLQAFKAGNWCGGPAPFGYTLVDGKLRINDAEAPILRQLVSWYLESNVGFKEIASRLAAAGMRTRKGKPWAFTTVRSILLNPVITGRVTYNRRAFKLNKSTGRRVPQWKDQGALLSRMDESLRIVSDEDFDLVQSRLASHRRFRPRGVAVIRPFTRLLFCGQCGNAYYARKSANSKGIYYYYGCGCRQQNGVEACPQSVYVREDELLSDLLATVTTALNSVDQLVAQVTKESKKRLDHHHSRAAEIKGEISEVDKAIASLMPLLMDPDVDAMAKKTVSRQIGEHETRRQQLGITLESLAEEQASDAEHLALTVRRVINNLGEMLGNVEPPRINRLLTDLVGPMRVQVDGTVVRMDTENDTAHNERKSMWAAGIVWS